MENYDDDYDENYEDEDTFEEISTEDDYDENYEDDITLSDIALITFLAILGCSVFAFIIKTISKHLNSVKLKIGNKIELGVESKTKEEQK